MILDHDAGEFSDDLRYIIPNKVRKSKHVFSFININGEFVLINADLKPGSWNRFCLLVNRENKHFSLYFNDKIAYEADTFPRELDQGNLWVLGLEKEGECEISRQVCKYDEILILSSSDTTSTFGALTDLQIWDRTLTTEELRDWSESSLPGNVLSWDSVQFNNQGLIIGEEDDTDILARSGGGGRETFDNLTITI